MDTSDAEESTGTSDELSESSVAKNVAPVVSVESSVATGFAPVVVTPVIVSSMATSVASSVVSTMDTSVAPVVSDGSSVATSVAPVVVSKNTSVTPVIVSSMATSVAPVVSSMATLSVAPVVIVSSMATNVEPIMSSMATSMAPVSSPMVTSMVASLSPVATPMVTVSAITTPVVSVASMTSPLAAVPSMEEFNSISSAPLDLIPTVAASVVESSDGEGTIARAHEKYVEVHHSHSSQNVRNALPSTGTETTLTASEDDQLLTPGQRENVENEEWMDSNEDLWSEEVEQSRKREMTSSAEEDPDSVIRLSLGSIVNSFSNVISRGSKKPKNG